jgi:hypothetical protein
MIICELKIGELFRFIGTNTCAVYRGENNYGSNYTIPGFAFGSNYVMGCDSEEIVERKVLPAGIAGETGCC